MQREPRTQSFADTLFRVSFSGIFLVAAFNHFQHPDVIVGRLTEAPLAALATGFAPAALLVHLTGLVLAVAGLALLLGLGTRAAAVVLGAVLIPITLTVHVGNPGHLGPLFKNVALLGGLLHFATRGGGAWSLDAQLARGRLRRLGAGAAVLLPVLWMAATAGAGQPAADGQTAATHAPAAGGPTTASRGAQQASAPSRSPAETPDRGAVLLVQKPGQLPVVLRSAATLAEEGAPEVHVVACGGAVGGLKEGPALAQARAAGVRLVACGLSLAKKGIDPASLPAGVDTVPNGILETVRLQQRGLVSVEL